MRIRPLLILTAIVSSILGAVVVYLVLTVPNDLQAGALLKTARRDIAAGKNDAARDSLSRIVQEYPRTDAAAAATVALVKLGEEETAKLRREVAALRKSAEHERTQQSALATGLQRSLEELKNAPPKVVIEKAPPPKPAPKAPVKKRSTTGRRR